MTGHSSLRSARTIATLAVTQLIAWGTTFDMLGVMGRVVAPDLRLPNEVVFAGLSIMMVVSALAGPATGRWLTRYGAAKVLAGSSAVFAVGLALLAVTTNVFVYAAAWVVIGFGGALGLSAPTYTAVVEREGPNAKRVIAVLMLFTGLSATIFWPVLSVFNAAFGWRLTFAACAALQLLVCLPLHLFALPEPAATTAKDAAAEMPPLVLSAAARRRAFLLIAGATTLSTFVTFGIAPTLIEVFRQSGASPAFALQLGSARGVIGISARGLDFALGRRGNPVISAAAGIGMMLIGFILMLTIPASAPLLIVFILLYGFGSGVMAVARALLPLSVFSAREYGLQAARLSLPQSLANAAAPVIFTAILDRAGTGMVLAVCLLLAAGALGLVAMLAGMTRAAQPSPAVP